MKAVIGQLAMRVDGSRSAAWRDRLASAAALGLALTFAAASRAQEPSAEPAPVVVDDIPPIPLERPAPRDLPVAPLLSLEDALALAWTQNPQVHQAELALRATDFEISGARAGYYPFIATQVSESEDTSNTLIRVVQPLWNGGLTGAQVDTARARQLAALAELNRVRLELGTRTAEAYFNVLQAQVQTEQADRYRTALDQLRGIIERRTNEGVATSADIQTVITRLRQAEASAESIRAVLASNRAQLASLLDRDVEQVMWPSGERMLSDAEVQEIATSEVDAHPTRQAALAQVKVQEGTARANKAALWPEIAVEFRHQVDGEFVEETNDDAVVLSAQYQTNNGLRGYRSYQAEKQRIESARARVEAALREIRANIRVARAERDAAKLQIDIQQQASDSSQALVESFMRQFEVGRKTWLELLNAHREANETVLQSISVKRNFWYANARLALQGLRWQRLSEQAPPIDVVRDQDQGFFK